MITLYISGDQLILPVSGPLDQRAMVISPLIWMAADNSGLVRCASDCPILFPLVFGSQQRGAKHPLKEFMSGGQFDVAAVGSQRLVERVRKMRSIWVGNWLKQHGVVLDDSEQMVARRLNARIFQDLILNLNVDHIDPAAFDNYGYPRCETIPFSTSEGQALFSAFLERLKVDVQITGFRAFAAGLGEPLPEWKQFQPPGNQSGGPNQKQSPEVANGFFKRYLRKHGVVGLFGATLSAAKATQLHGQNRKPDYTWPAPLATAHSQWEAAMRAKIPELPRKATDAQRDELGIQLDAKGAMTIDPGWVDREFAKVLKNSGWTSPGNTKLLGELKNRMKLFMSDHICERPYKLTATRIADPVFKFRIGVKGLAQYYARVEDAARQSLIGPAGTVITAPLEPPDWNDPANHEPLADRLLFKDGERVSLQALHTSFAGNDGWRAATNNLFLHGVITLEGAMRAYLQKAEVAYFPTRPDLTGRFWSEVFAASDRTVYWQILMEAYLAAWLWGWSQLLFANWSPLNGPGAPYLRCMFGTWGTLFCSAWKIESRERIPELERLPNLSDLVMRQLQADWIVHPPNFPVRYALDYAGQSLNVPSALNTAVLFADSKLKSVEYARAAKLIGNLLLAGHSRYGSMVIGEKFLEWANSKKLNPLAGRLFSQFGLLDTESWLTGPSLCALFQDTGQHERLLKRYGPLETGSFSAWTQLDEESIKSLWAKVSTAPLSYPVHIFSPALFQQTDTGSIPNLDPSTFWPLQWMQRLMDTVPRGQSPIDPGNRLVDDSKAERVGGYAWRQKIWGPLFRGGKLPDELVSPLSMLTPAAHKGRLIPPLESLFLAWLSPFEYVKEIVNYVPTSA